MKTILILGAGTGGVVTARELSRHSGNEEGITLVRILLFEKEGTNVYSPSLPWMMVGKRKQNEITGKTGRIPGSGVEVIKGEIEKIDPENISVTVEGQQYQGDHMVVSLGVEQTDILHLNKYGHNFFTIRGAEGFYSNLKSFERGEVAIVVSSLPFKSPAAPYEAAMLIQDYLGTHSLSGQTGVSLYTPEAGPMEFAGPQASKELKKLLENKGIRYYPGHELSEVSKGKLSFKNGKSYPFDLLAYTPKHEVPQVVKKSALVGDNSWIEVDTGSLATSFREVFAIGDVSEIKTKDGQPLPKIGVFARHQAEVVAHNLMKTIGGQTPDQVFVPEGKFFVEVGQGKASETGGMFSGTPSEQVKMKTPAHLGHLSKWWDEKIWFFKNF